MDQKTSMQNLKHHCHQTCPNANIARCGIYIPKQIQGYVTDSGSTINVWASTNKYISMQIPLQTRGWKQTDAEPKTLLSSDHFWCQNIQDGKNRPKQELFPIYESTNNNWGLATDFYLYPNSIPVGWLQEFQSRT